MKYVIILGDGMADEFNEKLGGTPLSKANIPNVSRLAGSAEIGLVKTVPDAFKPASDVANLSVMGYDPVVSYSGRSPLEALNIGIDMADTDVAYRCNLVTLSDDEPFENKKMVDYSAGEISTAEAAVLIKYIDKNLGTDKLHFYAGVSYRHCLIVNDGAVDNEVTPPHDISGRVIGAYLPKGVYRDTFIDLYKKSYELLKNHPLNLERVKAGKRPANCIWFWGGGVKPNLQNFYQKTGLHGAIISAVDLLKGIGRAAGMQVINVAGATGNYDTNFKGKGEAALDALADNDFCYVHIEAPDECGHRGEIDNKIYSIEMIDKEIVGTVTRGLESRGEDYALLFLPDHPTPVKLMTHTRTPVPYLMYCSKKALGANAAYNEEIAEKSGIYIDAAPKLFQKFISLK